MTLLPSFATSLRFAAPAVIASNSLIPRIRTFEKQCSSWTDSQLQAESLALRARVEGAKKVRSDEDTAIGLALIAESAFRAHQVRFYDVQFLAALSLLRNEVAEMKTGEGKTFVGAMVSYLRALHGCGVHFMTTNAYLARRDYETIRPIVERLGMTIGLIEREQSPREKQSAYARDITYGPGYEFGFDYLRDQLALIQRPEPGLGERYQMLSHGRAEMVVPQLQRGHYCAIVDEADSVMIDEATTPLILSGAAGGPAEHPDCYKLANQIASQLVRKQHFSIQPTNHRPSLTIAGQEQVAKRINHALGCYLLRPWYTYVEQALHAQFCLTRDVDYVVADDTVKIVDTHTGRIFEDRSWSEGLHQAVEAKEGVTITEENHSLAGISRQQYFRNYMNLCGMTGTTSDCERELLSVYGLKVSVIPTHRPSGRFVMACRTFLTDEAKWNAIADSVREVHQTHRPVLIGTRTIESSKKIAARLQGLRFQLLNGVQDGDEAKIIAGAGQRGAITIATNMAGRGTDIKLGDGVAALGGLHVIVSEPAETVRVDQQLMGRAARQGDPGTSQMFVSADDALITRHAPWMARYISKVSSHSHELADDFGSEIARLQKQVAQKAAGKRREMFSQQSRLDEMKALMAKKSG